MVRGGGGPWDRGGGTPEFPDIDIDKVIKKFREALRGKLPGAWVVLLLILLIVLFTGVYRVGVDERGVIQRFGKYVRKTEPGLHIKMPLGIERVTKVKVDRVYTEEFGFRTLRPGVRTEYARRGYLDESLMLTGDLNIAEVQWIIQFRIYDPVKYLFRVRNVRETIRHVSEAVMRQVLGDSSVNEAINKRQEIAHQAKMDMQAILDEYNTGIKLVTVEMQDVVPPDPVKAAFNEVNQAIQEKEKMINQAWEEYNKVIPLAKGEAEKAIKSAEGYALNRVNRAKGDANRFVAVWKEYSRAKDATRRRLYLETLQEVLPKMGNKYIVDPKQKGLLPLLDLGREGETK
jgi:membrane protease subunit HflK